ncbi:carbon storage regulator [Rubripirellula obstinata]|uniref:Translational regulator CsrA n=1 Tax=Rubripirellula obstinata TaxID=406547 RepID=A0A5B1CQI5_9BACT|nr:carbon storage regulator [Rubripirellula obstinata]KAA1262109.1 carbon storage regulator [Rubripirellula obstinata]
MLVLSRRSKDKVVFPQLGITIHFIRVQSGQVKIGIDAPREIKILRDELHTDEAAFERQLNLLPRDVRHGIRNELHQVSVGLHLFKELMIASLPEEADEVFVQIQEALGRLDAEEALNPPLKNGPKKNNGSVVLVEDQPNEREMLASVLRLKGVDVVALTNGTETIDYFRDNPAPRHLLIDMQMPECDGATAIKTLQSQGQLDSTTVFAVSGVSPEAYGISVGGDGVDSVDRWFPKPLNPTNLIDALTIAVG